MRTFLRDGGSQYIRMTKTDFSVTHLVITSNVCAQIATGKTKRKRTTRKIDHSIFGKKKGESCVFSNEPASDALCALPFLARLKLFPQCDIDDQVNIESSIVQCTQSKKGHASLDQN